MTRRPTRAETAPYYFTYIDQAPDGEIVAVLEQQGREIHAALSAMPVERTLVRPSPPAWSVRAIVGHVSDAERLFTARAFWFARGFQTPLPSFDQVTAAACAGADDRTWAALIEEFAAVRAATVAFFAGLPAEAWDRRGIASDAPFTVRALAYITAGHAAHHLRRLGER